MFPAPQQCPTCGHPLELRELSCPACETVVRGRWAAGPFSRLSPEQQTFLRLFVRSRGNLSEVERTLGVSYPTVRAKLEEVIELLGEQEPPAAPPPPAATTRPSARDELLQRIARGEVGVDEGLARLGSLTEES